MKWTTTLQRKQFLQWQVPKNLRDSAGLRDGDICHITLRVGKFAHPSTYKLTSGGEFRIRKDVADRIKALVEVKPTSKISFEIGFDITAHTYSDQFDVPPPDGSSTTRKVTATIRDRDPAVRRFALSRAAGKCQFCGQSGFHLPDGTQFLETHHIIPLAEGGNDSVRNVVALCPNHHREAHFGSNAKSIQKHLLKVVASE